MSCVGCLLGCVPFCLCLLSTCPHLSPPVGCQPPSVSACWVPICLCLLSSRPLLSLPVGCMPWAPLPVKYGSPPASALLGTCPHLSLLVVCVLFLPLLAGCVSPSVRALWARVPTHCCLTAAHLHPSLPVDARLCLLGVPPHPPLHVRRLSLPVRYPSSPQQLCWHGAFPLQAHGHDEGDRARGRPAGGGEGGQERKGPW